jgi:hypothetical protein
MLMGKCVMGKGEPVVPILKIPCFVDYTTYLDSGGGEVSLQSLPFLVGPFWILLLKKKNLERKTKCNLYRMLLNV